MPKTLQGTKKPALIGQAKVPVNGDDMEASDLEVPIQVLLDDVAYLLDELKTVTLALQNHGHSVATADKSGFMSPGDRAAIAGLADALALHRHDNATTTTDGFFSKDEKKKLSEIESKAQTVTKARVNEALGAKQATKIFPDSTFAAGAVKMFTINIPGVSGGDCVLASRYEENEGEFSLMYRCSQDAVLMFAKNLASQSRTFTPGEITVKVLTSQNIQTP